jgi:ABC-type branched-subunit amino acid transport system permease subunit
MTILGGVGTLFGPVIGAWLIKYFENIFSAFNEGILSRFFGFLPDGAHDVAVAIASKFVGEGWQLTLGLLFVLIVVFLPGGIMEGVRRLTAMFTRPNRPSPGAMRAQPAE